MARYWLIWKLRHWLTRCIIVLQMWRQKKEGAIPRDVEAAGLADTLADNLAVVKAGNVGKTLTALKTASEVVTLASTLAETG